MATKKTGGLLVLIVLAAIAIGGYLAFVKNPQPAPTNDNSTQAFGGEIVYTEGAVEFKTKDGDWTRASKGTFVSEGYSVETMSDGRVIIALDEGSVVRMDANSQISFDTLNANNVLIKHEKGKLYSRVLASQRIFDVNLNENGGVHALGTAFMTIKNPDEEGVEVYHSSVEVWQNNESTKVEEGHYYLVNSSDSSKVKKVLEIPTDKITADKFVTWNKTEDEKSFKNEMGVLASKDSAETDEDEEESSETQSVSKITLSYVKNGAVTWTVEGEAPKGFKLVWSKNQNPTYPTRDGDQYVYYSDPAARSGQTTSFDGAGTYYIRVCEYLGDKCGVYSNQLQATYFGSDETKEETETPAKETPTAAVTSIAASTSGQTVKWTLNGYSKNGFKIVWSKNQNPTYPTRSGDKYIYLSDPGARSTTLDAFDGAGTYYVRVCEYLGGACGVYSNQVIVTFAQTQETTAVSSITLYGSGSSLSWSVNGFSKNGYKVVWSKNSGPTYPTRSGDQYQYLSDPNTISTTVDAFDGAGTYYVRVCEYLGGACGVYSNQITVDLEE